jgi:hypothetical protein
MMSRSTTGLDPMNITHGNILAVFFSASTTERLEGLEWYARATRISRELADAYKVTNGFDTVAGIIAALSPNNRWHRNVQDAEALIRAYTLGTNLDAVKVSTYSKNKTKAIAILNGENPLDILGGNKVRAFYRCIIGEDDVCVDGHAYSIWLGQRVPTTKTPKISDKLYQAIAEDYRIAASQINTILGSNTYSPAQVQAVTWVTWRNHNKGAHNE